MRSLERIVALLPSSSSVSLSICLSVTGVYCDHRVLANADVSLWLDSAVFGVPWHQSMFTYSQPSFSSSAWKRGGVWMCKLGVICQERLKIEVKLLLSANRSRICRSDWHNNGWPWVTLNGRFTHRAVSLR